MGISNLKRTVFFLIFAILPLSIVTPNDEVSGEPEARPESEPVEGTPEPAGAGLPFRTRELPLDEKGNPRPLSLEEVVHFVLDNNNTVRIQQLEILKSDTELKKDNAKYAPVASASYQGYEKTDKSTPSTLFSGTKTNQDVFKAGVTKLFSTGTYAGIEVSDTRYDSNAGEGTVAYYNSFASMLAQDPLHTGAVTLQLRQELLKNAFGYSQERLNQIAENNSSIQRENMTYQLSQLVVQAMIDYWNLAIAEEQVQTREMLLRNTKNLRNITMRKTRLGLAEPFEVNQWNALTASAESELQQAILNRDNTRRNLLRTMNLDPSTPLTGATKLLDKLPPDLDVDQDIDNAYRTRPDFKNIALSRKNAELAKDMADNNLLPSVSIAGQYSWRDQGRHARNAYYDAASGKYHEASVEFKVEYPIGDEGAEVDARNARISLEQVSIQESQLKRQIHDDVKQGYDQIVASKEILEKARFSLSETQTYYNRLVTRYGQGRFTAEAVKQALDALVQARLGVLQSTVGFNIALIQYDMTRNVIWEKFHVDVDQVIDRLAR